ncbi:MAG: response regulator transcription factor [Dehalococcoidia bacterium]
MYGTEQLVLAIDDEPGILKIIKMELTERGFRVLTASDGQAGLQLAEKHRPDLVLLDIIMPEMSGIEVLRELRERSSVPVIMLSARRGEADKVRGLELGADDYLGKPFSLDELGARVRAILRRTSPTPAAGAVVTAGDVEIDLESRIVRRGEEIVNLTRTEWNLLQCLASNPDKVMLSAELLGKVWGPEYVGDLQYLRVWISRLRTKLGSNTSGRNILRTFPGIGYMLSTQQSVAPSDEGTNGHAPALGSDPESDPGSADASEDASDEASHEATNADRVRRA